MIHKRCIWVVLLMGITVPVWAQQQLSEAHVAAMTKFDFWVGEWEGEGWAMGRDGQRHTFTVYEKIEKQLEGVVLLVEGIGKAKEATPENDGQGHHAMALIGYDAPTDTYIMQSFLRNGQNTRAHLEMTGDRSFVWWFDVPNGMRIQYTVTVNDAGQWVEKGQMTRDGGTTWFPFMEQTLSRIEG